MWSPLILEKYIPKPLTVRALFFCVTAKTLTKSISVASVASVSGVYKGKPGVIKGKRVIMSQVSDISCPRSRGPMALGLSSDHGANT